MNIIFDVDDTLYDQRETFRGAYEQVFGTAYDLPLDGLFVRMRARSDEVFDQVEAGEMSMREMYAYRMCRAFEDFDVKISDGKALDFQAAYVKNQGKMKLLPGIVRLLDLLMTKAIPRGIITNGPKEHQWKKIRCLGLEKWFAPESIFISGEVGCAKPSPSIFKRAEKQLALAPEETIYIGDAFHNDVVGAKRAGWQAVWLNRRKNKIPTAFEERPDYVVPDEYALMAVLEKLI